MIVHLSGKKSNDCLTHLLCSGLKQSKPCYRKLVWRRLGYLPWSDWLELKNCGSGFERKGECNYSEDSLAIVCKLCSIGPSDCSDLFVVLLPVLCGNPKEGEVGKSTPCRCHIAVISIEILSNLSSSANYWWFSWTNIVAYSSLNLMEYFSLIISWTRTNDWIVYYWPPGSRDMKGRSLFEFGLFLLEEFLGEAACKRRIGSSVKIWH